MIKIPNKKEFLGITTIYQYIQHWNANYQDAQKMDSVKLVKEVEIIPNDTVFTCKAAFTDINESKTHLWATGSVSKYLLKYNWSTSSVSWFYFGIPINQMAQGKLYIIVLATDGGKKFKFDPATSMTIAEYPTSSSLGYQPLYVAHFLYQETSDIFIFRTSNDKIPVYDLSNEEEILVTEFSIPNANTAGIFHPAQLNYFITSNN